VTARDFEKHLERRYETNEVEFKGPGIRTTKAFLATVVRGMLGMANRRDGGYVIIGVESTKRSPVGTEFNPVGLSEEQAASWLGYDDLSSSVNEYASPSVSFDPTLVIYQERKFAVIRVHQFVDIPILCTKDFGGPGKGARGGDGQSTQILRRGACYVRSRHKPETSEIPSEEEMRELLELAIDKGVRKFVARAQLAGLFPPIGASPRPGDETRSDEQAEDLE
jgi:predicted HTH transcriptional regulator